MCEGAPRGFHRIQGVGRGHSSDARKALGDGDGQGDGRDAGADKDEEGDGIDAGADNKDGDAGIDTDSEHTKGEDGRTDVEGFGVCKGEVADDGVGEEVTSSKVSST
ncbi:hypothetical protein Pcinc_008206 [Petrolisthes cinctipes]|uniref:Uncharacterized protein n=1 Tax=Petrolisthes cinctipes TaxID=88211 RepID=A0AAE1KW50_PETCI|nr:hypothetical protein Pcinc_008206 [Petrolisthes cinctipes]